MTPTADAIGSGRPTTPARPTSRRPRSTSWRALWLTSSAAPSASAASASNRNCSPAALGASQGQQTGFVHRRAKSAYTRFFRGGFPRAREGVVAGRFIRLVRSVLVLIALWPLHAAAQQQPDVAIILAVDVSRSIDDDEFQLQRRGYA